MSLQVKKLYDQIVGSPKQESLGEPSRSVIPPSMRNRAADIESGSVEQVQYNYKELASDLMHSAVSLASSMANLKDDSAYNSLPQINSLKLASPAHSYRSDATLADGRYDDGEVVINPPIFGNQRESIGTTLRNQILPYAASTPSLPTMPQQQVEQSKVQTPKLLPNARSEPELNRMSQVEDYDSVGEIAPTMMPTSVPVSPKYSGVYVPQSTNQLAELQQQLAQSNHARQQMQGVVQEYESTMHAMIEESRKDKERSQLVIDKLTADKLNLTSQLNSIQGSVHSTHSLQEQLHAKTEQIKKMEAHHKAAIDKLNHELQLSESRLLTLKQHAEKKLQEANTTLQSMNKDVPIFYQAKLARSEAKVKSLEDQLALKVKENAELVTICDDLIKKMEG